MRHPRVHQHRLILDSLQNGVTELCVVVPDVVDNLNSND